MQSKFGNIFKLRKIFAIFSIIIILIICCSTLMACDPVTYYFEQEELSDIIKVELINYDNTEQKRFKSWVPDHTSDLRPIDNNKICTLEALDENKIGQFIDTLCEYEILYRFYVFDSPNGVCLKLSYANGDFIIINCHMPSFDGYIGKFTSNGEVAEFIGCFSASSSFKTLVNDFFQMTIED